MLTTRRILRNKNIIPNTVMCQLYDEVNQTSMPVFRLFFNLLLQLLMRLFFFTGGNGLPYRGHMRTLHLLSGSSKKKQASSSSVVPATGTCCCFVNFCVTFKAKPLSSTWPVSAPFLLPLHSSSSTFTAACSLIIYACAAFAFALWES